MEFEAWSVLLLLPVFFGLGWFAARIDLKQLLAESKKIPQLYSQALFALLNQQHAIAVQACRELVERKGQSVDLRFALGHLLRRQGELEQAITLHQQLLVRVDLQPSEQDQARFELAQDFLKAGIFDRAEEALKLLLNSSLRAEALKSLLHVYQMARKWQAAIDVAQELGGEGHLLKQQVAQYHCELGQQNLQRQAFTACIAECERALQENARCARANLLLGEVAYQQGKLQNALTIWQSIEAQDWRYLALLAPRMVLAYQQLQQTAAGFLYLNGLRQQGLFDIEPSLIQLSTQANAVQMLLSAALIQRPNPQTAALYLQSEAPAHAVPVLEWQALRSVMLTVHNKQSVYRCTACGFRAQQHFWRCPACAGWETIDPQRGA
jgi:lipopolysaccharide biosynthesis regulator YciM